MIEHFHYIVTDEYDGMRIDKLISELIDSFSRSYIQRIIKDGQVTINNNVAKASTGVSEGDEIDMDVPPSMVPEIEPQDIPLDIIYEDSDVLVVNKPKNMVVHPRKWC